MEKKYQILTINENLKIIKIAEQTSIHNAARLSGKNRKTIARWMNQKEEFKKQTKKNKRKTLGKDKPAQTINIEHELLDFIRYNRKLGNPLTIWILIVELIKKDPTYKDKTENALCK